MYQKPGFVNLRNKNEVREQIRNREYGVNIAGISLTLEDLSPAANVHGTRYVNRIDAANVEIENTPRSAEKNDMDAAQRVEDYFNSIAANIRRQKHAGIVAPYRRHLDDMAFYGVGVIRVGFKPHIREKLFPETAKDTDEVVSIVEAAFEKGFEEDPFMFECPAVSTVAFSLDFSEVCEVGKLTISDVLDSHEDLQFSTAEGFKKITTSETRPEFDNTWDELQVTSYHLETNDWIYDVIDHAGIGDAQTGKGFPMSKIPNIIGRPWYAITFAHVTNNPDISKRYLPLINDIYPVVHSLNFLSTLLLTGSLSTGRPMYQMIDQHAGAQTLTQMMTTPVEQKPVLAFDPSEELLRTPEPGKRWDVVPVPDMKWVIAVVDKLESRLERWGFPVSLGPEVSTEGKAESGVQGMQQIEVAANYLNPAQANVALSLYEMFQIVGDALTEMGVKVKIPVRRKGKETKETLTILPTDFKDHDLSVSLKSQEASAQLAIRSADLELVQLKMMSKTTFFRIHYPKWQQELQLVFLDEGKALGEQKILELIDQFAKAEGPAIIQQAAADQQIAVPNLAEQSGGPAEPGGARNSRPPVPLPGAGASPITVDQNPLVNAAAGIAQDVQVQ